MVKLLIYEVKTNFIISFTSEKRLRFEKNQATPEQPIKIPVKHKTSKFNIDFKNLSKYKPRKLKRNIVPAEKRTPLVKWRPIGKELISDIGGEYSPELNMTSEKIAKVAYDNMTANKSVSDFFFRDEKHDNQDDSVIRAFLR